MERYFEWDDGKAEINWRKHGVPFKLATQVFDDPFALIEQDRIANGEERWQTIGATHDGLLLLLVAHTVRIEEDDGVDAEIVRIISARRVDRKERKRYEHR
jgi:uncharacterized DUF497 family protein